VHTSCLYTYSATLTALKLNGVLIGDCFTNSTYRGQSVYPKMLQFIAKENKGHSVYVFVSPFNQPSIAGIEKAGAKKWCHFKAEKILLLFFSKRIVFF